MVAIQIKPSPFRQTKNWVKFQSWEQDPKDLEEFKKFVETRFEESKLFEEFSKNRLETSQVKR